MTRFLACIAIAFSSVAFAQQEVRMSQMNPDTGYQQIFFYDGSNNLQAICQAASRQTVSPNISVASATNANPVVFTVSGGHGLSTSFRPQVTISGGTGNWAGVNGTYTATPISTTTFSIPVNSTTFGALAGTVIFTTTSPRINQAVWSVQYFTYDGSNNLIGTSWYGGNPGAKTTCSAVPTQYQ